METKKYPFDREIACLWLKRKGYVKIYSEKLDEYFFLTRNASLHVPGVEGHARYTIKEMGDLEGMEFEEVLVLHNAKKLFNGIISKPDKKKTK
jgi:hypothetical protein